MKNLNFSNRIALYFLLATSTLILVLFTTVYFVVFKTVYSHLDDDLTAESLEVFNGIVTLSDRMMIANSLEWGEPEHSQIEVNPAFVQITDTLGRLVKKTPNLIDGKLMVDSALKTKHYFNTYLADAEVRQLQMPVTNHFGKILGYLSIAIPLKDSELVLRNLRTVLILAFPVVLLILYFLVDILVRRNIYPVNEITEATQKITHKHLNRRVPLPKHKDELYTLVKTINGLLDRLQDSVDREKHFIADASHELRTPLASLKGNLEVMLRKIRAPEYYIAKTTYGLEEVNRLSSLVEQLLILARYDNDSIPLALKKFRIEELVHDSLVRTGHVLEQNKISVDIRLPDDAVIESDRFMLEQILDNLISNAAKYSYPDNQIEIIWKNQNEENKLLIRDHGIGMNEEQVKRIFERFYRADASRNFIKQGNGLGMAIIKRLADRLGLNIHIESEPGRGTSVELEFPTEIES